MDPLLILLLVVAAITAVTTLIRTRAHGKLTIGQIATQTAWILVGAIVILGLVVAVSTGSVGAVVVFVLLGIFVTIGYVIGKAAERKGRSFLAFFLLSIVASPIVMGIIVATLPPINTASAAQVADSTDPKPSSVVEELRNLAELHAQGSLTEAEFEAAKLAVLKG